MSGTPDDQMIQRVTALMPVLVLLIAVLLEPSIQGTVVLPRSLYWDSAAVPYIAATKSAAITSTSTCTY